MQGQEPKQETKRSRIRSLDERFRFFDRDVHRTQGGILRHFGIHRHSPGVLILPTLVCGWMVAGSPALGLRLLYALLTALLVLFITLVMTKRYCGAPLWKDLAVQIVVVGAVGLIVWVRGGDVFQVDKVYRHMFLPLAGMMIIAMAFAAWLAPRLFRDLGDTSRFADYLPRTELFADYGPERQVTFPILALSGVTAPFRGPLQLLLLPALTAILMRPEWLHWGAGIALGFAFFLLVIAGVDDRFSTIWKLFQSGFFRGGALMVSLAVILFAALRVAGVSYVTTVLDSAAGQVVIFILVGAYVFLWWFDYWVARMLSQQVLRLIRPHADRQAWIEYPIFAPATGVPRDGRFLQIHGASRFIAIRPCDPPGYEPPPAEAHQFVAAPQPTDPAPQVPGVTAAPTTMAMPPLGVPEKPHLRKITLFQAHRIDELIALLAVSGAPGGMAKPLPSQIMARVFNYHALSAGLLVLMIALGMWSLHKGVQLPELEATTSQAGVSLASLLFNQQRIDAGRPVIVVAASGGGTRAALYTSSVMFGLSRHNVTKDIVLGSGISGGGAALAYFAANLKNLAEDNQNAREEAWKNYFDAMKQPYIQDVLERASEWRIINGARLGFLLAESMERRWNLPADHRTLGQVSDFGLILNTSVAGHFDRSDASEQSREGPLIEVERRNRNLTRSELAGGRLILTNLQLDPKFAGEALEGHRNHTLPIVVNDPKIPLATAAALNANFPPVFSDAAVDVDGNSRFWVTDGGAVDNRGMEMLLYAIRESLNQNPRRKLPRLQVVVADASAYSNSFSQDRGAATMAAAGTKFASQLAREIVETIRAKYEQAGQKEDFAFWYLFMPDELRTSGSFGTHWMLQPHIQIRHKTAAGGASDVTLTGEQMVCVLQSLYTDRNVCKLTADSSKVLDWVQEAIGQWPALVASLAAKPPRKQ
jgi:hypothetical protein